MHRTGYKHSTTHCTSHSICCLSFSHSRVQHLATCCLPSYPPSAEATAYFLGLSMLFRLPSIPLPAVAAAAQQQHVKQGVIISIKLIMHPARALPGGKIVHGCSHHHTLPPPQALDGYRGLCSICYCQVPALLAAVCKTVLRANSTAAVSPPHSQTNTNYSTSSKVDA